MRTMDVVELFRAREMRRYPTDAERKLWQLLRGRIAPRHGIRQGADQLLADPRPACSAFAIAHTFSTSAPSSVAEAAANAPKELIRRGAHNQRGECTGTHRGANARRIPVDDGIAHGGASYAIGPLHGEQPTSP